MMPNIYFHNNYYNYHISDISIKFPAETIKTDYTSSSRPSVCPHFGKLV